MPLLTVANEWGLRILSTADGTRPANAFGTAVTPLVTPNTYGTYAQLISGANLTDDVYEWRININSAGISAVARDTIISVGLDPAGGTTYTSLVDLVVGPANAYNLNGPGVWYQFPHFIKAGTSIAVAASTNSVNVTACNVFIVCMCRPSRPDMIWTGTYIDQFGVSTATSAGTAVTPGTASDGAYVQLGANLTRPCYYWEMGMGCNNAAMTNNVLHADLAIGDGTNKKGVISNSPYQTGSAEVMSKLRLGRYGIGAIGDGVYARCQVGPNAADTGMSIAAYGVG